MLHLIIALALVVFCLWIIGMVIVNDFDLPSKKMQQYKRVLFVYPHADDENGGLIHMVSQYGNKTILVILTKGERGTTDAHLDTTLKAIRTNEAQKVAKIYGLTKLVQNDFGDGQLQKKN